jgi:hypothetical protein
MSAVDDRDDVFKPISSFLPVPPGKQKADAKDPKREWICTGCNGAGVVLATDLEAPDAGPTVFRCSCYRGEHDRRPYPSWKNADPKRFRRPT